MLKRTDYNHSNETVDPTLGAIDQQCNPSQTVHQVDSTYLRSAAWDYQQTAPGDPGGKIHSHVLAAV